MRSRKSTPFPLLKFPNEIIHRVLSKINDFSSLQRILRTAKCVRAFGDPKTQYGSQLWRNVRMRQGLPDPAIISLSDFKLLQAYYGRGCEGCDEHPSMRIVTWEFGATRFCKDCIRYFTIRDYEMSEQQKTFAQDVGLPYTTTDFYSRLSGYSSYRSYLREHMSNSPSSTATVQQLTRFKNLIGSYEAKRKRALEDAKAVLNRERVKDITGLMREMYPTMHVGTYHHMWTYCRAVDKETSFTKRAKSRFISQLKQEISDRYFDILARYIEDFARYPRDFLRSLSYQNALKKNFTPGIFPQEELVRDVFRPILDEWLELQQRYNDLQHALVGLSLKCQREVCSGYNIENLSGDELLQLLQKIEEAKQTERKANLDCYGKRIKERAFYCKCGFFKRKLGYFKDIEGHVTQSTGNHKIMVVA